MVDSFSRVKNIKYTCVAHEQAAAMMADSTQEWVQICLVQWLHLDQGQQT